MRRILALACAVALVSVTLWLVSCKSNSYTTQPVTGELGSPQLAASSGAYAHTFNTVGTFRYKCMIHPTCTSLQGVVTVVGAGVGIKDDVQAITFSGGTVYGGTCSMLSNTADSVHVGETVTWTNASPLPHTVSSY
jgi:hypothetical protein